MALKLLIDPLARGAYFSDIVTVARAELEAVFPGVEATVDERRTVTFLDVSLEEDRAPELARLSFVQAIFAADGPSLRLIDASPDHLLPPELVWGAKYRGKTHELLTQLALNVAIAACEGEPTTLLDPMAGRGTTLLWGLRYGLEAWGVEKDGQALDHLQRHLKRQTKLHRLRHDLTRGGKSGRDGAFLDIRFPSTGGRLRLITGDSRQATERVQNKRFDLVVADLPYGVQFVGPSGTRNPLKTVAACAQGWANALQPGGALVLAYNRLLPAREQLAAPFVAAGLTLHPTEAPHRMSESILRDLLVLTKPR